MVETPKEGRKEKEMTDLAKGTEVFAPSSLIRPVAVDRRSKKGKLWLVPSWGKGREEAHGLWIPVEGNGELLLFCQRAQKAIVPLADQVSNLNEQIGQIGAFAKLTMETLIEGSISQYDLDHRLGYGQAKEQLGDGLDSNEWWPRYTATLPDGIGGPIRVHGQDTSLGIPVPGQIEETHG